VNVNEVLHVNPVAQFDSVNRGAYLLLQCYLAIYNSIPGCQGFASNFDIVLVGSPQ